jgi:hypothetical protein
VTAGTSRLGLAALVAAALGILYLATGEMGWAIAFVVAPIALASADAGLSIVGERRRRRGGASHGREFDAAFGGRRRRRSRRNAPWSARRAWARNEPGSVRVIGARTRDPSGPSRRINRERGLRGVNAREAHRPNRRFDGAFASPSGNRGARGDRPDRDGTCRRDGRVALCTGWRRPRARHCKKP